MNTKSHTGNEKQKKETDQRGPEKTTESGVNKRRMIADDSVRVHFPPAIITDHELSCA